MSKAPKISVLMSAYNAYNDLGNSIESILDQDFKDFELLIMDDCSTDNTKKLIKKYSNIDSRVKF